MFTCPLPISCYFGIFKGFFSHQKDKARKSLNHTKKELPSVYSCIKTLQAKTPSSPPQPSAQTRTYCTCVLSARDNKKRAIIKNMAARFQLYLFIISPSPILSFFSHEQNRGEKKQPSLSLSLSIARSLVP